MNELPAVRPGDDHLLRLKDRLATLFQKMEKEYEEKGCDLSQCEFDKSHIKCG